MWSRGPILIALAAFCAANTVWAQAVESQGGVAVGEQKSDGPELVLQTAHSEPVRSAAFSPDSRRAFTGSRDGTAILWDVASGRKLRTLEGHTAPVWSVALGPDGRHALTGSWDGTAILWEIVSGKKLHTFNVDAGNVNSVAFSPDGRQVITAAFGIAILWDSASGAELRAFEGHTDVVNSVAFSPDGRQVLTGSGDKSAILWDVNSGDELRTFTSHSGAVTSASFSPDGRQLLTGSHDKTAIQWDVATGKQIRTLKAHNDLVWSVAISRNGQQALTASNRSVILWDLATGKNLRTFKGPHDSIWAVAFSKDGREVLAGAFMSATLWDTASGKTLRTFGSDADDPVTVAISADSQQLITGSSLWDVGSGELLRTFEHAPGMTLSPDGRQVLTGVLSKTATLCDVASGRKLRTFEGHKHPITSLAFSPDGRQALTGSGDRTAMLWDVARGQRIRTFEGHADVVNAVAFNPDGRQALTGSGDDTVVLWDVASGKTLWTRGHAYSVQCVAFSPDGRHALSGSVDGTAILWDVTSGQRIRDFEGHTGGVFSAAFSPDGRQLLTGSKDRTAILWDVESGQNLRVFEGFVGAVISVAFSPDGRRVLTGSTDETARLWDATSGEVLLNLIGLAGDEWLVATPEGLFDGSAGGREQVSYRVGGGLDVVPVDRFFQDYYSPGLLAAIWKGDRPKPKVQIGSSNPPTLRIVSPAEGGAVEQSLQTIILEVTEMGGGITPPWLMHNGMRVQDRESEERSDDTLRQTYRVRLVQGDNELKFQSASADGSWESEPVSITFRYEKSLPQSELFVLAVGISQYADESFNLKYAAGDARALADVFKQRGGSLYSEVHATVLVDKQATTEEIKKALKKTAQTARPQDTILTFLAGHGATIDQRYYFLPHEYQHQSGATVEEDVRRGGLPADVLEDHFRKCPAVKRILICDTCQSDVGARDSQALRVALERLHRAHGTHSIYAVPPGEQAKEVDELRHGVLTYTLLAGLEAINTGPLKDKPISSPDPIVTTRVWFDYAEMQMPELMKTYYGRELNPYLSNIGDGFPVLMLDRN